MRQNRLLTLGPGPGARMIRTLFLGMTLGVVILFSLISLSSAAGDSPPPFFGEFNPVSVDPVPLGQWAVLSPSAPAAGALIYADFRQLEAEARDLLDRNRKFREDISPYRGANSFAEIVRKFDAASGFDSAAASTTYTDTVTGAPMTLFGRINQADEELRQARDLYAYLAVFASEASFRGDDGNNDAIPGNNYRDTLCNRPEDPNPQKTPPDGTVLEPVIDWCNFPARLRQSVREAANIRLIFAQEFMVDALGLHFSAGALQGGDTAVKSEIADLTAAAYQYEQVEMGVSEALGRVVGNGCFVSDYFTQTEWALLSRAAEGKELAQHHMAVRLSYMNITDVGDVPDQQAEAEGVYRASSIDAYVKLVGMAGRASLPPGEGCNSQPPENLLVASMATNMLDTRARAREMREGRNIFGFDIAFTPTRPYRSSGTTQGLYEQAKEEAEAAAIIEEATILSERTFDTNQAMLRDQIEKLNTELLVDIGSMSGCDSQDNPEIADLAACVEEQITLVSACQVGDPGFDVCLNNSAIETSDLKTTKREVGILWLTLGQIQTRHQNILLRSEIEDNRAQRITYSINGTAQDLSVKEAIIIAGNCCEVSVGSDGASTSTNPGAVLEAGLRPGLIMKQAAHDMEVEDANAEAVIRNLFLDLAEAQYDIDMAFQQLGGKQDEFNNLIGDIRHDLFEVQRQQAYTVNGRTNPANDPGYRMTRDSKRLELAAALEKASRTAYLAARRAEYEYAARLFASNFRISDIYKARTAGDVLKFLSDLNGTVQNLAGAIKDAEVQSQQIDVSVVYHVLGLTDQYLATQGFSGAAAQVERQARLQQWINDNQIDNGQKLQFQLTTTSDTKGILSNVIANNYGLVWLLQLSGIGAPKPENTGVGINIVTDQTGPNLRYDVTIRQSAHVEQTTFAGCLFSYRLMPSAVMLGLDWPGNQPTDTVLGVLKAEVNGANGTNTPQFLRRPMAANWQVTITKNSPDNIIPDLVLSDVTDIVLKFSATRATRGNNTLPQPTDCVRTDF